MKNDTIYRQEALRTDCFGDGHDGLRAFHVYEDYLKMRKYLESLPSAQPEQHEIGYSECANAMLKMWIDNVLTDGEYSRIMDKLNAHWAERREG